MPNTKNIQQVEVLTEKLGRAKAIYITQYLGLNVEDVTELRREFHSNGVEFLVAKNTLLKLAAKSNKIDGLDPYLSGPTAVALSYEDPTGPARVLKKFTKDRDLPEVKGIVFDGDVLDGSEFKRIADMPTKEQLLGMLAALLQSPLTNLMWALKSPMTDLGNALSNLKDKKSN
ncbi:MAG: 50S ribosomal protein L10 [Candidatus Marinimicrobia bacterium]|jgi:large subunit ribosomal protein L10|nr:50S ribosomal protein L10 [Candidatus Neomarinimicrobiota bacterium]MBT3676615.1 50S ribosomal protein L10 [Candidatus Neomarinimicrobiota bacterium]MBT3763995.1 50S ribosomal protein L10 [Candidatus Neomarinimicrobiota bacterium]MBT4067666.1 50S ribosomal protein L10 [Candidatus Neomarinimicrobiota bacterium]MBT4307547.1 50S ribosomal protein L10 [Candidatus Neomarinimicrobiota bacterium]